MVVDDTAAGIGIDQTVDAVVAGSGGGLAGAYTAAREGLSVAVLEETAPRPNCRRPTFGAVPP